MYIFDPRMPERPADNSKNLFSRVRTFLGDESGMVTVDFVVLTSAIVVTAVVTVISIGEGVTTANDRTAKCLSIQAKMYGKDIPYQKQLKRIRRRCARL